METILQAAGALLAAVIVAITPAAVALVRALADAAQQKALATVQQRLGEGAARIAAEIVAKVQADPGVEAATRQMLDAGAATLHARFAQEIAKRGIPRSTLEGMLAGELGKLGLSVQR